MQGMSCPYVPLSFSCNGSTTIRMSTLYDLSVDCLCRTNYVHPVSLVAFPTLPLPSMAEEILVNRAFPNVLPRPVADGLIEGLAKRGKLTASLLDVLLDPKRVRLSNLPLHGLRTVNGNDLVNGLRKQTNLCSLDVSFSPCFVGLDPPLLNAVSEKCKESLTFFAANHVTGDFGFPILSRFLNLRHVDVSFTSVSFEECRDVFPALVQLEHLNVSGTCLSWHQLFQAATDLVKLKHLGMGSLTFLHDSEFESLLTPNFTTDWISGFFVKRPHLSYLDISYANYNYRRSSSIATSAFADAFHAVLVSMPSLTCLETTALSLSEVAEELQATGRLSQLKFLGYFGYIGGSIPPELTSRDNLQMALRSECPGSQLEFCFREEYTQKDHESFRDATLYAQSFAGRPSGFVSRGLIPFTSILLSGLRLRSAEFQWSLTRALGVVLRHASDYFEPKKEDAYMCKFWEQMLEFCLQAGLDQTVEVDNNFLFCIYSLLTKYPKFLTERRALLYLSLAFISEKAGQSEEGSEALFSLLPFLQDKQRERLALEGGLLQKLCQRLVVLQGESETVLDDLDTPDTESTTDWDSYRDRCSDRSGPVINGGRQLFKAFGKLISGLPAALKYLAESTTAIEGMAKMALYGADECNHGRDSDADLYVGAMEVLASVAECQVTRTCLVLPEVIEATVAILGFSFGSILMLSSYLSCLLLVCEDVAWPKKCASKQKVITEVIGGMLQEIAQTSKRGGSIPPSIHHSTLLPVLEMAKCQRFPEVAVFGLWRLTFLCGDQFNPSEYGGLCPICLVKKEIGIDEIKKLEVPNVFKDVKIDLDAIVSQCNSHEGYHLPE
eukprot:m.40129 g.40129  ORF g.40129 m.40129 type:complete len:837 (+) comp32907_c0_seq3:749-3259(+)